MNKSECENLNGVINHISSLRDGFYLSSFFIQPHLFHITNPMRESELNEHSHSTFEISMIIEGTFTYIINSKEFTLNPGDLIIIPPRMKHCWRMHDDQTFIANNMCLISGKGMQPRQQNTNLKKSIEKHQYHIRKFACYESCIRDICNLLNKKVPFRDDEVRALQKTSYIYFLRALLPDYLNNEQPCKNIDYKNKDQLVEQIKYYIFDNLSRPISLNELQKIFGYSKDHLNRIFKKHQKMPIIQFIIHCKMERAAKMLATTHVDIKNIALEIGISDVNYFYNVFKKITGESPAEFRKQRQKY